MGTMIQRHGLQEPITAASALPIIRMISRATTTCWSCGRTSSAASMPNTWEAGADILETCTFNATSLSQADYNPEPWSMN